MMARSLPLLVVSAMALGCGSPSGDSSEMDASSIDGSSIDGSSIDGSFDVSSSSDAGPATDALELDAHVLDVGATLDTGTGASDAGPSDAEVALDTGTDGGEADAGESDSGAIVPPAPWMNTCSGASITSDDVLSHFAPAATEATFGTVWADARERRCQDKTGCQDWEATTSVDLYRINWTGSGFTFIDPTTLNVPSSGTIRCTVPGPNCTLSIAPITSNVYPPEQGRPLGITPRVAGGQVQVGSWSSSPRGNYIQYTSSSVAATCLWGSMSGRVYGGSGTYVETELVIWGTL